MTLSRRAWRRCLELVGGRDFDMARINRRKCCAQCSAAIHACSQDWRPSGSRRIGRGIDAADRHAWLERLSIFFDVPSSHSNRSSAMQSQVEACLDRLMSFLARREGKSRWVEKTPYNAGHIDRILSVWPGAKVLHVVRDPRDVYASMVEIGKWTEPTVFAEHWCNTVGAARDWLAPQEARIPPITRSATSGSCSRRKRPCARWSRFSARHGNLETRHVRGPATGFRARAAGDRQGRARR